MRFILAVVALSLAACAEATPPPVVPIAPVAPSSEPPAPKAPARPAGVPGTSIRFTGGDGSSLDQAILIEGAKGEIDGVRSEYQYLELLLGPRGTWKRTKQSLVEKNGRKYDVLEVEHQGKPLTFYFDITLYFGKM